MLLISMPYKLEHFGTVMTMIIKPLRIVVTAATLKEVHDLAKKEIEQIVGSKVTKESVIFEQNPKNENRGLLISSFWSELLDKSLEIEPLVETRDAKNERQKRLESQDHLEQLK